MAGWQLGWLPITIWLALPGFVAATLHGQTHQDQLIQTFSIKESFGVTHPRQIIDFDCTNQVDWPNAYMLGPGGSEVPYQVLRTGNLAVEADLPAGATNTWSLMCGHPPAATNAGMTVGECDTWYEIANGPTGIRIAKAAADLRHPPAPVQGVLCRDGTWTARGTNELTFPVFPGLVLPTRATNMAVRFVERGPLKVVVEVSYGLWRDAYVSIEEKAPAGPGFYRCTIEVQAGQPSILFEEETDTEVAWTLDLHEGLQPTHGRYRGHHSSSREYGYEADGRQYRNSHERPPMDAFVDFSYAHPVTLDYVASPTTRPPLAVWDIWIANSGWYWQLFNTNAPADANIIGIFAGPPARAWGAANSGVGIVSGPAAVTDLVTATDAAGSLHAVYQRRDELWYVKFDAALAAGSPERIAGNVEHPDLLVASEGRVSVIAYDRLAERLVLFSKTNSEPFIAGGLPLQEPGKFAQTDPYAYQASSGTNDFLVLFGAYDGQTGAHLFHRSAGNALFAFRSSLSVDFARLVSRPAFVALPDGSLVFYYTFPSGYLARATIPPGATTFGGANDGRLDPWTLNFGAAADPAGNVFAGDQAGNLNFWTPSGGWTTTPLGLMVDHHGQGPNRRSLAVSANGDMLATHGKAWPYSEPRLYRRVGGQWTEFAEAQSLHIAAARVHYHPHTDQFIIVGRSDGQLAVFGWRAGEAAPRLIQRLPETEARTAGVALSINRGCPDGRFFPRVRFAWGLFAGVKGQDLADPCQVQPIARQMNLRAGVNLNKVHRLHLDFPDPPQGYGGLFMEPEALQRIIQKLRDDPLGPHGNGYYGYLHRVEPSLDPLYEMWVDTTGQKVAAVAQDIAGLATDLLGELINGDGDYSPRFGYWGGGSEMNRRGLWIDSVLAEPLTTAQDRARVKAAAALFAGVLWDNDFVPLFDAHGLNLGQQNMQVQQHGYRAFYALLLSQSPDIAGHAASVEQQTLGAFNSLLTAHGESIACPSYTGPGMAPLLNNALQLRMTGGVDAFAQVSQLTRFTDFYLGLVTPPECRFGGLRKLISLGDGATQAPDVLLGQLATGFRSADPELSAVMMGAWAEAGKPHSSYFGSTLLMMDEEAPRKARALPSANFPGYCSVWRSGWGTPEENALWFVHGDYYSEHRHLDHGGIVFYALGAPLSLDWGSMYCPHVAGGFMHNLVVAESDVGQAWDADNAPLESGLAWTRGAQEAFTAFAASGHSRARFSAPDGTAWTRTVFFLHPNEAYPVVLLADAFSGTNAEAAKILTLNLMATGAVDTPVGLVSPPPRRNYCYEEPHELPSASAPFSLPAGTNRFGFTGQWLIDWDLYTVATNAQQALVGNWGHNSHPTREADEFQRAQGRPFEESQHILRVRGPGPFATLILPFRKGQRRADLTVAQEGGRIVVATANDATTIGPDWYAFTNAQRTAVASFGALPVEIHGVHLSGGPTELILEPDRLLITAHGSSGVREIQVPGTWAAVPPLVATTSGFALDYSGEAPLQLVLGHIPPPAVADGLVDAISLTGPSGSASGFNNRATKEAGEPNHGGWRGGRSVWWSWVTPVSGHYVLSTAGSDFDTLLGVYTGSAISNLTLCASNDDAATNVVTSQVSFEAVAGTTYHFAVDGFQGASGHVQLTWNTNAAPTIAAVPDQSLDEGVPWTLTVGAVDADPQTNALTFTLGTNAPAGMSIDLHSGVIAWTPTEEQGPGSYQVSVLVSDNDTPPLSATATFSVTVNEVNRVPFLKPEGPYDLIGVDVGVPGNPVEPGSIHVQADGTAEVLASGSDVWGSADALYFAHQKARGGFDVRVEVVSLEPVAWFTRAGLMARETLEAGSRNVAFFVSPVGPAQGGGSGANQYLASYRAATNAGTADWPGAGRLDGVPYPHAWLRLTRVGDTFTAFRAIDGSNWTVYAEMQFPGMAEELLVGLGTCAMDNRPGQSALARYQNYRITPWRPSVVPPPPVVLPESTILESQTVMLRMVAFDADLPAQQLAFALDPSAPEGAAIDPLTGAFSWTPGEAQEPGTYTFNAIVADNGSPPIKATNTFTVTVNESNRPLVLPLQADRTMDELTLLTVTNTASDADLPANALTYTLVNPPEGAVISADGIITWTPSEAQGPSTNLFVTVVTDTNEFAVNETSLIATNSFTVVVNEVNVAPVLTLPADQATDELVAWSANATATDADLPANPLSYALLDAPEGAVISPDGIITWTPSEAQGPGEYPISVRVFDDGVPSLSHTQSFTLTINEVNVAPVLPPQADRTMDELTSLTVTNTATDSDLPANPLSYALIEAPPGAVISAEGVITWTPSEAQGPSTNLFITAVTDTNEPAIDEINLSMTNTFTVVVNEVNLAPVLAVPANATIDELVTCSANATATDADIPVNTLTFELLSGPSGLTVSTGGAIAWTPSEAQGPGEYPISVRVFDDGVPSLSHTQSFTLTVNEVNVAPQLARIADCGVSACQTISFNASATDADSPANALAFSLVNPPAGAAIDANSGAFTWRIPLSLTDTTNSVTVRVVDDGAPALEAVQSFNMVVQPLRPIVLTPLGFASDGFQLSVTGLVGSEYVFQRSHDLSNWTSFLTNTPTSLPCNVTDTNAASGKQFYRVLIGP